MKNLTLVTLTIFVFLISCNTKKEHETSESLKNNTKNLSKLFTKSELSSKTSNELKLIRNEIYARKGYVFKNVELQKYFIKKKWYTPKRNIKIILSEIDNQNVNLIKQVETEKKVNLIHSEATNSKLFGYRDTININYIENKTLLNILKILPETTMRSWGWSKKDREKTVEFIEDNNFIIDTTEMYNNIKYIKPNTIGIQVVDGSWTLSIYEFGENDFLIITNDIVGDGNDIQTFSYYNNKIKPFKMVNGFSEFEYDLLLNNASIKCVEMLKENENTYDYDFSDKNFVSISSWLINKEESGNCLKGNSIRYRLNKEKKIFELIDVYWKNKENE